jgi:hypothetical protein
VAVSREKGALRFTSEAYSLTFLNDRPFVRVESRGGDRLAELFVLSGVHALHSRDDTTRIGAWEIDEQPGITTFLLRVESSLWNVKQYRFRCNPHRFTYDVEIEGNGQLAEVNYFGGYHSGQPRWGSGFFWSGQHFRSVFNPEPNTAENNYFPPETNVSIDLMGVPVPGRDDWFFTPPPFCFAMQFPEGWISLGVETVPGQNRFTDYSYHGKPSAFYLSLAYDGQTVIDGRYQLPAIGFDFAVDEYAALEEHAKAWSAIQPSSVESSEIQQTKPNWWRRPIFCGWGSQCYLAGSQGGHSPDYARQEVYEDFLKTLRAEDLNPGIVVLDDKWQLTYGENQVDESKWPDLPAFVAHQHDQGRKVLLWLKAWDAEGLPVEECITNAAGLPIAADPSNPDYARRLRMAVRRMISYEGYDADGFKIDFTARIPAGPGLKVHGDTWGLELMRLYLSILHSEAKHVKPDALIMAHTPHPYLQDVVDMIRLNDINTGQDVNTSMTHRARVATIACPNLIIDTDDWPMPNKPAWRAYTRLQPKLGVPSLYYVTHIDSTGEPLDAEDYALIREVWSRFSDTSQVPLDQREKGLSTHPQVAGDK